MSAEEIARTIYERTRSARARQYTIRPATCADSRFIYELSMDPRTREMSTRSDEFTREEHERWYADKMAHPERHRIWIMELGNGMPVGQVRYGVVPCAAGHGDPRDCRGCPVRAEIAISIIPSEWGKGYGLTFLAESMPLAREWLGIDTFVALVIRTNHVGRRLFRRAGFHFVGIEERLGKCHARYEQVRG